MEQLVLSRQVKDAIQDRLTADVHFRGGELLPHRAQEAQAAAGHLLASSADEDAYSVVNSLKREWAFVPGFKTVEVAKKLGAYAANIGTKTHDYTSAHLKGGEELITFQREKQVERERKQEAKRLQKEREADEKRLQREQKEQRKRWEREARERTIERDRRTE
ncbi:MAG: hypothetical protein ABIH99_00045 [Candidatus Micrarchaeota archaeon]